MRRRSSSSEEESSSDHQRSPTPPTGKKERKEEQVTAEVKTAPEVPQKTEAQLALDKASPFEPAETPREEKETPRQEKKPEDNREKRSKTGRSKSRHRRKSSRGRRRDRDTERKHKDAKKDTKSEKKTHSSHKDKDRKTQKEKKERRSKSCEDTRKEPATGSNERAKKKPKEDMVTVLDTTQKPAHPSTPPKNKGDAAQQGKAKGKTGKAPKKKCQHCHQWVTSTPAGVDQHQWLNELCLTWQIYNNMPWEVRQKQESWDKACHMAKTLKEARLTRAHEELDVQTLAGTESPLTVRSSHTVQRRVVPEVAKDSTPEQSGAKPLEEALKQSGRKLPECPEERPARQVAVDTSEATAGRRREKKKRRRSSSSSSAASRRKGKSRVTINIR